MFLRYKHIVLYGISMAFILWLLKSLELRFLIIDYVLEIYIGAIAIIFTSLGIWLALKLTKPKMVIVEKEVYLKTDADFTPNEKQIQQLGISKRELEVLQLMADGLSNQEIADKIFVSLNTIKTHSSKLFEKLEVDRRTQAIEKAKRMNIIP